jgi:hypothetical protein
MNKLILIFIVSGIILSSNGCTDFLSQTNPNQLASDNFWNNMDDCEMGLVAVYNSFMNRFIMNTVEEAYRGDETWPGYGRPNTVNAYYNKTFTSASPSPNNKWSALYTGIFRANQVIEAVNRLTPTLTNISDQNRAMLILAQARFFRGLYYYYLYTSFNFGSVVIFDGIPKDESEFYKKLSPAEEVAGFFVADLEFAYQNLPKSSTLTDKSRVSAGAAAAVLGQFYLYVKEYDNAIVYFKDIIENPEYGYSLVSNIGENFSAAGELNSESILEVTYSNNFKSEVAAYSDEQTSNPLNYYFSPVGGWRSVLPSCWLTVAYKSDPVDPLDTRNIVADPNELEGKRLRKYSLRTSYSLALVDDPDLPYYQKTPPQAASFGNYEFAYFRKHTNWATVTNENLTNNRSGINYRVIRLADVYLMYAECLIRGGTNESGVNEALRHINKVRNRAGVVKIGKTSEGEYPTLTYDNKSYSARDVMNHLMYIERPLELSVEGHAIRLIDMRRWGITKARFTELASKIYYANNYEFMDTNGTKKTKWNSMLVEGTMTGKVTFVDFLQAKDNYDEAAHSFWPIPNGETVANPNIIN